LAMAEGTPLPLRVAKCTRQLPLVAPDPGAPLPASHTYAVNPQEAPAPPPIDVAVLATAGKVLEAALEGEALSPTLLQSLWPCLAASSPQGIDPAHLVMLPADIQGWALDHNIRSVYILRLPPSLTVAPICSHIIGLLSAILVLECSLTASGAYQVVKKIVISTEDQEATPRKPHTHPT
jgi:hypothetical protein